MAAVLLEHYGGKWPFWLSPRQCLVVPVKDSVNDYAEAVAARVHAAGFFAEADVSGKTMQNKVMGSGIWGTGGAERGVVWWWWWWWGWW